jgi:hypothetical protein
MPAAVHIWPAAHAGLQTFAAHSGQLLEPEFGSAGGALQLASNSEPPHQKLLQSANFANRPTTNRTMLMVNLAKLRLKRFSSTKWPTDQLVMNA